jgi:hypothetical protein
MLKVGSAACLGGSKDSVLKGTIPTEFTAGSLLGLGGGKKICPEGFPRTAWDTRGNPTFLIPSAHSLVFFPSQHSSLNTPHSHMDTFIGRHTTYTKACIPPHHKPRHTPHIDIWTTEILTQTYTTHMHTFLETHRLWLACTYPQSHIRTYTDTIHTHAGVHWTPRTHTHTHASLLV